MIEINGVKDFNTDHIFDCGQCFRFEKKDGIWQGVALGRVIKIKENEHTLEFNMSKEEFEKDFFHYFDLGRDYRKIDSILTADRRFKKASEYAAGIHILNQEPFETLCSFIISQNNNIPRIKGIISRLCENFGERLEGGSFSFPSAQRLAALSPEELAPLRAGFRNKYIIDAAQKVASGEVDLNALKDAPAQEIRESLMKIKGVGAKVAECTLLFGFGYVDAFPVDVWVRRVVGELYPNGLPDCMSGVSGIAQQYLFHWRRNLGA